MAPPMDPPLKRCCNFMVLDNNADCTLWCCVNQGPLANSVDRDIGLLYPPYFFVCIISRLLSNGGHDDGSRVEKGQVHRKIKRKQIGLLIKSEASVRNCSTNKISNRPTLLLCI